LVAFTQVETQLTVDKIHNVWHPQIVHDIHQQGAYGARLFLPPYMEPVEPNVPREIVEGYTELGLWRWRRICARKVSVASRGTHPTTHGRPHAPIALSRRRENFERDRIGAFSYSAHSQV
jgi:hypothetical protein